MAKRTTRIVLILLIVASLWLIIGDQISYFAETRLSSPNCQNFAATVMLTKDLGKGEILVGNGVVIGKRAILTAKHLGVDKEFQITIGDKSYGKIVIKVENDPSGDLTVIHTSTDLEVTPAKQTTDFELPFTMITIRNGKKVAVYAGNRFVLDEGYLTFNNRAVVAGDSGAPLLNNRCEVVAIVHGGEHSFLWYLRPTSQYTPLNK